MTIIEFPKERQTESMALDGSREPETIVVVVDHARYVRSLASAAVRLSRHWEAEILAVHVVREDFAVGHGRAYCRSIRALVEEGRELLGEVEELAVSSGVPYRRQLLGSDGGGGRAEAVSVLTSQVGARRVVAGSPVSGGSLAKELTRECWCPVLVVGGDAEDGAHSRG